MKRAGTALVLLVLGIVLTACGATEAPTQEQESAPLGQAEATTNVVDPDAQERPSQEIQPLNVVDSGWSYGKYNTTSVAVLIENPNEGWQCLRPKVGILLKDQEGKTVHNYFESPMVIAPNAMCPIAAIFNDLPQNIADIEISITTKAEDWTDANFVPQDAYVVSNFEMYFNDRGISGTVTQVKPVELEEEVGGILLTAIGYNQDGKILGGGSATVMKPVLDQAMAFDIPTELVDAARYVVYARPSVYSEG